MIRAWSPRQRLSFWRRRLHEWCGNDRYSWPALNGLDRALAARIDRDCGYFIEAGANNGYAQSNTYALERLRGWRGLLIEPHPALAARCRVERPASTVIEAALVAPDFEGNSIGLHPAGLMSMVEGAWGNQSQTEARIALLHSLNEPDAHLQLRVPARTLSAILDEANAPAEIDLLSLDVEGYEVPALRGLDLTRHRPRFICVEARNIASVVAVLDPHYKQVAVLAENEDYADLLFSLR